MIYATGFSWLGCDPIERCPTLPRSGLNLSGYLKIGENVSSPLCRQILKSEQNVKIHAMIVAEELGVGLEERI